MNFPMETSINKIRIECYDGNERVHTSYNINYGDPQTQLLKSPSSFRLENVPRLVTADPPNCALNPSEERFMRVNHNNSNFVAVPLNKALTFRIRAEKTIQGEIQQYRIGGDFSRVGWNGPAHEYTLLGQRLKDDGLEGFINYVNQLYGDQGAGSQNLGG